MIVPFELSHTTVASLHPAPTRVNAVGASAVAQSQSLQPAGFATHWPEVLTPPVLRVFFPTMQYCVDVVHMAGLRSSAHENDAGLPLDPLLPLDPPVDGVEDDEQATTKTAARMVRWDRFIMAGAYNRA